MAYEVNYDDERFDTVEQDKQEALTDLEKTYGGMIEESDKYYEAQIEASKQWADKQSQLQQEQTDFAIEQIEQQKGQAHKDYIKEQSGAYVDWQKQSNQYGAEAEKMASSGLERTGFSESSQVSMYNQYQNRVTSAREVFNQAVLNYNNAIKDAQLQNNSVLAEIAYNSLQQQLELSLQGFQYKNNLLLEQANKKVELDNMYYQRWQDVLNQINTENAFNEEVRQFNANYELQKKEFEEQIRQFNQSYKLELDKFNEDIRQFNEEIARLKKKDEQEYKLQIEQLELEKQKAEEAKRQFEAEMAFKQQQLAEQKRQFDEQQKKTSYSYSGGGGTSGGSIKGGSTGSTGGIKQKAEKASNTGSGIALTIGGKTAYVNSASVIDCGYGPLSSAGLLQKVAEGKIVLYNKNGQLYAKRNNVRDTALGLKSFS